MSEATYVAFDTIIDTAIDEHVHAVVIAGDIYNSEDHNLEAQVRFVRAPCIVWQNIALQYIWCKVIMILLKAGRLNCRCRIMCMYSPSEQVQRFPLIVNNIEIGGVYGISCGHGNEIDNYARQYRAFERDEFSLAVMHGTVGSSAGSENHNVTGPCSLTGFSRGGYGLLGIRTYSQISSS